MAPALRFSDWFFAGLRKEGAAAEACYGDGEEMRIFDPEKRVDVACNLRMVPEEHF